jgi:tRNA G46 methylase TrmB
MFDKNSLDSEQIFKGITDQKNLVKIVEDILDKNGKVHLETDMRADAQSHADESNCCRNSKSCSET